MRNLYVIEGTSNSGKTTTSKYLSGIPNISIIPEFMEHPLSPKPSKNLSEELENQLIFFEIEQERMKLAKSLLLDGQIVFLERSYLSILAVSYAFEKLGRYYSYDNALKLYNSMLTESWFIKPDAIYILAASHDEKVRRNKSRGKELKKNWIQEEFEYYQDEFYATISVSSDKIFIDTSNCNDNYAAEIITKSLKIGRW